MIKKNIQIVLFIGLITFLIVGAYNRTQAKNLDVQYRPDGVGAEEVDHRGQSDNEGTAQGKAGRGNQGRRGSSNPNDLENPFDPESQELPDRTEKSPPAQTMDEVMDIFTVETRVESMNSEFLVLSTLSGQQYEIEGRAWVFTQGTDFIPEIGDHVSLTGYYDEFNEYKVISMVNTSAGTSITIRDENGRPMWAGFID